jgi:hypothetical protein
MSDGRLIAPIGRGLYALLGTALTMPKGRIELTPASSRRFSKPKRRGIKELTMSSHTRCQQGDLAIITQDVPLCRANIGTLVRVLEPCYDFPKEYGFMWKIQPLSPHPTPVLLGVRGEDQEVVYDKAIRSHSDGWLMPVRPSNDNEEYTDLEAEQSTTRKGVTKLRGHSLIIAPKRWTQALALACDAHHGQMRKGTAVPYLSHVLAVSGLVLELGGDEDQALAGLCAMRLKMVDRRLLNPSYKPLVHECLGWFKAVQTVCQSQQVQKKTGPPESEDSLGN